MTVSAAVRTTFDGPGQSTMPPPIRYPLPTLLALFIFALAFWRGEAMTRPIRSALAARLARAVEGPPLPHSDRPQVVAGPITRKALLLHNDIPASDRPGGTAVETIRRRGFVEVYDTWPLTGEPTHYRVGSRRPIGWVRAADLLPWDTRLVVRGPDAPLPLAEGPDHESPASTHVGRSSLPVLGWSPDAVRVAVWNPEHPWSEIDRRAWVRQQALPPRCWGVWLSREELLALLRRSLASSESPPRLRLRALLGRLLDDRPLTDADLQAADAALPAPALTIAAGSPAEVSDRLARANEDWSPETSWGGVSFEFIPLDMLP
jgi:hypothetical protein